MGRARSGWEVKEWMRTEREIERKTDSRGGFTSRAMMARWVVVSKWFKRQRRKKKRLIFVRSSWVRPSSWGCLVGFGAVIDSEVEEEMENENGVVVNFEAQEMICNGF
ncbi:hypothetical protein ACFX2J_009247 [Malus domestica]